MYVCMYVCNKFIICFHSFYVYIGLKGTNMIKYSVHMDVYVCMYVCMYECKLSEKLA